MISAAQVAVNHFQYGPYILVMIPLVAAGGAWYVKRIAGQIDAARAAQQNYIAQQLAASASANASNTKGILEVSRQLSMIAQSQGERIARLEGQEGIKSGS